MKNIKTLLLIIFGIIVGGLIGVGATNLISSDQVIYKNDKTVDEALDELFEKSSGSDNLKYDEETHQVLVYNTTLDQFVPIAILPSIPLSNVYLYNNGDSATWITGGWTASTSCGWNTDSEIYFTGANVSSSYLVFEAGKTINTIDLTNYNELHIKGYGIDSSYGVIRISIAQNGTAKKFVDLTGTTETEVVMDITDISGNYTISIGTVLYSYASANFHISEIWLS